MNTAICVAIGSRSIIQFYYDGGLRTIEPHCHGISRAGKEVLRGYQTAGYSKSGNPVGWKLFEVAKISRLNILNQTFAENRPEYNPNDRGMQQIHCHV